MSNKLRIIILKFLSQHNTKWFKYVLTSISVWMLSCDNYLTSLSSLQGRGWQLLSYTESLPHSSSSWIPVSYLPLIASVRPPGVSVSLPQSVYSVPGPKIFNNILNVSSMHIHVDVHVICSYNLMYNNFMLLI